MRRSALSSLKAQMFDTYASNLTQNNVGTINTISWHAQRFTTGSNSGGYLLSSISVAMADTLYGDVSVCTADNNGFPTDTCTVLSRPSPRSMGTVEFTAPSNTTLQADITYSVIVGYWPNAAVSFTTSDSEDENPTPGWSISNDYEFRRRNQGALIGQPEFFWQRTIMGRSLRIAINGKTTSGEPIVVGQPRVPAVLTAETSNIMDLDGLTRVAFTYQWIRVDADGRSNPNNIGTDSNTVTLTNAEAGSRIKVRVSFSDDNGNAQSITSDALPTDRNTIHPVATCNPPTLVGGATQIWTGTVTVGEHKSSGLVSYGYAPAFMNPGLLNVPTFSISTNEFSILELYERSSILFLRLDADLRAVSELRTMTLYACDEAFVYRSAGVGIDNVFSWHSSTGLDWSTQATRTLYLVQDTTAPVLRYAILKGTSLELTFSEDLDTDTVPTSGFSVMADTTTEMLVANDAISISGNTVTLTLAMEPAPGSTVTVSYAKPSSGNRLRDAAYNEVADFTDHMVQEPGGCELPDLVSRRSIWTGTLSVGKWSGTFATSSGGSFYELYGYGYNGPPAASLVGGVSPDHFSISNADYSIDFLLLWAHDPSVSNIMSYKPGYLTFSLNEELSAVTREDLRFHICAEEFNFIDSGFRSDDVDYAWFAPGLDWSSVDELTLHLSLPDVSLASEIQSEETPSEETPSEETPPVPTAINAAFYSVPPEHDGSGTFTVELGFSLEPPGISYRTVRDHLFAVESGRITGAKRTNPPKNDRFRLTIEPAGNAKVSLSLNDLPSCGEPNAMCSEDGQSLTGPLTLAVPGPVALSVADAQAQEGPEATLSFVVTLDRRRHAEVSVHYATSDVSATSGADYTVVSDTLTFVAGETSKTIEVEVLDDEQDEGVETLTLTLTNPLGARIDDDTATGTIQNSDALPRVWLARFGRTVAEQVLDAVDGRFQASRRRGVMLSFAGRRLGFGSMDEMQAQGFRVGLQMLTDWFRRRENSGSGTKWQRIAHRDVLAGSSFALTGGARETGFGVLWARGALSRFDGREGNLTVDGKIRSAMLGADFVRGRGTFGMLVSRSYGDGGYSGVNAGRTESTITGLYPYGHYTLGEQIGLWGIVGYGIGTLTLTPEAEPPTRTDMDLGMVSAGLRGELLKLSENGGPGLATTVDALVVHTSSDAVHDTGSSNLAEASANVTRLRLGLEGSMPVRLSSVAVLIPILEVGVRRDGGDAETGFGADVGAGVAWSVASIGLDVEIRGRGLLLHEAERFSETGFSGTISWDPYPSSERGISLTLGQRMGSAASGGANALLSHRTMEGLARNEGGGQLANRRFEAHLGYGIGMYRDRFVATPSFGVALSQTNRRYFLGLRHAIVRSSLVSFDLTTEVVRQELTIDGNTPEYGANLRVTAKW